MTAEEQSQLTQLTEAVDRIDGRTERLEVALLGDVAMGNIGLVARVQRLEDKVQALTPLATVFGVAAKYWPATIVLVFYLITGGNPANALELASRMLR